MCCLKILKDASVSSEEEETSIAMAQSGRYSHKLDESDDDFNSNQLSPDTATLSVQFLNVLHHIFLISQIKKSYLIIFAEPNPAVPDRAAK